MHTADHYFDKKLSYKSSENQLRQLNTETATIDFSSNDYLGLAQQYFSTVTRGSTGSRLLSGNYKEIEQLERELANFYHAQQALVFSSGFQANIGLLSALGERSDTYLIDAEIHASMKVGSRLSTTSCWKFEHNNVIDLEQKLKKVNGRVWVFIEALYSMSGDLAPLQEIVSLCKNYNAYLVVDEAHSNGIYGPNGEGLVVEMGLEKEVTARIMTFGKAFGAEGAGILGSQSLKNYLINFSYPFIYSTAPSLGFVNTLIHQLNTVKAANLQRQSLFQNIKLFQQIVSDSSLNWSKNFSPIQALRIGNIEQTKLIAERLKKEDFYVFPIISPTVPIGEEQIRFCLHSYNSEEEIHLLFKTIESIT